MRNGQPRTGEQYSVCGNDGRMGGHGVEGGATVGGGEACLYYIERDCSGARGVGRKDVHGGLGHNNGYRGVKKQKGYRGCGDTQRLEGKGFVRM